MDILSMVLSPEFVYQGLRFHRNIKVNIPLRNRPLGKRNDDIMMLFVINYVSKKRSSSIFKYFKNQK